MKIIIYFLFLIKISFSFIKIRNYFTTRTACLVENKLYLSKYDSFEEPLSPEWFRLSKPPNSNNDDNSAYLNSRLISPDNIRDKFGRESEYIRELAIFPLDHACSFPTSIRPLHIFVKKFRQMMNEVQLNDKLFGIVMSTPEGGLCKVGTAFHLVRREIFDDGTQFCVNEAKNRFKIIEIVQEEPYIIAKVEMNLQDKECKQIESEIKNNYNEGKFDMITLPDDILSIEKEVWQTFQDVVNLNNQQKSSSSNRQEYEIEGPVLDLSPTNVGMRLKVSTSFSFALCDLLDLSDIQQQILLECMSLKGRFIMIRKFLNGLRSDLMKKLAEREPFN
eukprot:gene4557-6429_t